MKRCSRRAAEAQRGEGEEHSLLYGWAAGREIPVNSADRVKTVPDTLSVPLRAHKKHSLRPRGIPGSLKSR